MLFFKYICVHNCVLKRFYFLCFKKIVGKCCIHKCPALQFCNISQNYTVIVPKQNAFL